MEPARFLEEEIDSQALSETLHQILRINIQKLLTSWPSAQVTTSSPSLLILILHSMDTSIAKDISWIQTVGKSIMQFYELECYEIFTRMQNYTMPNLNLFQILK